MGAISPLSVHRRIERQWAERINSLRQIRSQIVIGTKRTLQRVFNNDDSLIPVPTSSSSSGFAKHFFHWSGSRRRRILSRRSIFGALDLTGILGCFDRARQSRRLFNMFGGLVRLVLGLRQLWLRSLKLFFDRRFPRHFGFSLALHGSNIDLANWLRHLRQILGQRL